MEACASALFGVRTTEDYRRTSMTAGHAALDIMNTKLYVGNLAPTATENDLRFLCSPHGNVAEVNLPDGRESGRPRDFAIVTMATPQGARAAILALNGREVAARVLTATECVPARQAPPAAGHN